MNVVEDDYPGRVMPGFFNDGYDTAAMDGIRASSDLPANVWTVWPVDNTKVWSETLTADVDGGSAELMRYWILLDSGDVYYYYRLGIE